MHVNIASHWSLLFLILAFVSQGCTEYKVMDDDRELSLLIGHRCILTRPSVFPVGEIHSLPTLGSLPQSGPIVQLQSGTILRVTHVENWYGFIDANGSKIYAQIENGPKKGGSIEIGIPSHTDPSGGWVVDLWDDQGRSVVPYEARDDGLFWAGVIVDGKRIPQMRNPP